MTATTLDRTATISQKCDRCGFRAYVLTKTYAGSVFAWCGHHARTSWNPAVGEILVDNRDELTIKETAVHA